MRVILSDWLALQARIRGFENPRLLRDRPSDGAAMVCEKLCECREWRRCASYGGLLVVRGWWREDAGAMVHARGARTY